MRIARAAIGVGVLIAAVWSSLILALWLVESLVMRYITVSALRTILGLSIYAAVAALWFLAFRKIVPRVIAKACAKHRWCK